MGECENVTLEMVYKKLQNIEMEVREISDDLHEVRPEFAEKLKKAEKGKFRVFKSIEEMEKHIEGSC
ncbi:TPA: hypothetical protein HA238_05045 [Candidatus Micrarchaeota archaeon]|nr:hypothetical protein [Candidatus Micrarchaeota archaeon]